MFHIIWEVGAERKVSIWRHIYLIPLKYRCILKKSDHIRPAHLLIIPGRNFPTMIMVADVWSDLVGCRGFNLNHWPAVLKSHIRNLEALHRSLPIVLNRIKLTALKISQLVILNYSRWIACKLHHFFRTSESASVLHLTSEIQMVSLWTAAGSTGSNSLLKTFQQSTSPDQ